MDFLDNLVLSVNDVLYAYVLIILLVGLVYLQNRLCAAALH